MSASDDKVELIPSSNVLKRLAKLSVQTSDKVSTLNGDYGEEIAKAVDKHGLDTAAFAIAKRLFKKLTKDPVKGGRMLRNTLLYIDSMELEAMAATELPMGDGAEEVEGDGKKGPAATVRDAAARSEAALQELKAKAGATGQEGGAPKPH